MTPSSNEVAMRIVMCSVALLLSGCSPPPDAPEQLEELTSWLFGKVRDGTDEELEVGVNNLTNWLDGRYAEASEGYTVDSLSQATAGAADGRDPELGDLVGASVATSLNFSLDRVEHAMMLDDQMDVFEGEYEAYDRDFDGQPRCFVKRECLTEGARTQSTNKYAMGLSMDVDFNSEWRWVEAKDGWTVVYRTWLRKPADVSADWLGVNYQYFVGVNMPHNGKTRRLQTTWISASLGDTPVPEATALNMVVDAMANTDETLSSYLAGD
jgi:hypothetical protein